LWNDTRYTKLQLRADYSTAFLAAAFDEIAAVAGRHARPETHFTFSFSV